MKARGSYEIKKIKQYYSLFLLKTFLFLLICAIVYHISAEQ